MTVPLIVEPLTPDEFKQRFSRDSVAHAEVYFIIQRMRPRTGPGDNSFLLVELQGMWVLWGVDHTPSGVWFIPESEEFMVANTDATFGAILQSISNEEFYDCFTVPQPEIFRNKLQQRFTR